MKTSCAQVERSLTEVKAEFVFPEGIIGFPANKQYTFVPEKSKEPFAWLESAESGGPSFIIIDPREFKPDYAPILTETDRRALDVTDDQECQFYAIVVVSNNSDSISANLLAPLVFNRKKMIGRQVVLQDQDYSVQHLILEEMVNA